MYKIIGADGKEYGPVTTEQLRQWTREGRTSAQTKVQAEGSTEWKALGEFSEFADLLGSAGTGPVVPPVVGAVDPEALAAQILARDYTIDIGGCIGRGWELVKKDFWLLIGVSFVGWLITAGGCIPYLGPIIGLVVGGPMMGGVYALYLKKIRGQPATFGDAFIGFSTAFVPLMLTHLVSGLLPLVMDKKIEFRPAMELSRKVVTKHWWLMLGFLFVCGLVALAGVLACCVGVFVSAAIVQAALMYAYEDIFGAQTTAQAG